MRLRDGPLPRTYEWMRADPDYDDPLPSMVSMVPAALVVVALGILLLGLTIAMVGGPKG